MTVTPDRSEILLVDDDMVDVMIVQRALRDLGVTNELVHAANGEEALTYLRGRKGKTPGVILLDLNMPKMNGLELLELLKTDPTFQRIPVVIVTTSEEPQDRARSFHLGAAAYVVKALDYREFQQKMRAIEQYLTPTPPPERQCRPYREAPTDTVPARRATAGTAGRPKTDKMWGERDI